MTTGTCGGCGAAIIWVVTEAGKSMPVDAQPAAKGNLVLIPSAHGAPLSHVENLLDPDGPRYLSHFASCPKADTFRRR